MSDTESIFAKTEYQATEHGGSDSDDDSDEEQDDLSATKHSKRDLDTGSVDQARAGGGTTTITKERDVRGDEVDADNRSYGADEGEDGDDEGEGEGAHEVPGESAAINASVFAPEVLLVLQESWEEWKAAGQKDRKAIWKGLGDRLHALDVHKDMDSAEWSARLRLYNLWMRRCHRGRGQNKAIRLGQKWTARSVIRETDKERLRDIIAERFRKPRNAANIEYWQPALTILMKELSQEQLEAAEATAKEWNSRGGSAEAQHRFTTRGAYKVMKGFTEEMWKRGGLQLVILSGYRDDKGELYSQIYDFNKKIANGPEFTETDALLDPFDKYLIECFPEAEGETMEDAAEAETKNVRKRRTIINRDELIKKITMADGTTWIPDIAGATRAEKQALVRAFLTSHYRDACQKHTASAPFKKLWMFQDKLFLQHHLPRRFVFPDDPSHMTTGDATRFLTFIRKQQEEHPEDIFEFQHWLNGTRLMKPGSPDEEGDDADDSDSGSIEGDAGETVDQTKEKTGSSAVNDTYQEPDPIMGAQTAEGSKSGQIVAVQPIGNANVKPRVADEEATPARGRSKGKERADTIPGSQKRVADMTDPVSKAAGQKGDTCPHPDHGAHGSSPPAVHSQTSSLRHHKTSKKPPSKGKRKANIGKSVQVPSKGPARIAEPTVQDAALAGLDDINPVIFSMRPPTKSIVLQERERLKGSVATRQPTPGPSTARLVKGSDAKSTQGPSNTTGHQQMKTGPAVVPDKLVVRNLGTDRPPDEDSGEALHDAYREIPVVPLEHPDGPSRQAQPKHHTRGPPLKSAMKKKASTSNVPYGHTGLANHGESDIPSATPTAANNTARKVAQQSTESANASRTLDTTGGNSSEHKRREVKRIRSTSVDQQNQAQGSPTKWDIEEEPATPPMKMPQGKLPEKRINRKRGKPSGPQVGHSANIPPTGHVTESQVWPEPETPRRSGRNRRPPPAPDADFTAGQPKAKKHKQMF